jgi:imidazolonepropionase-like amidohydrolase
MSPRLLSSSICAAVLSALVFSAAPVAQQTSPSPTPALHAKANHRLVIRNAMIIYGNAKPAYGPMDIVIEDGRIASILPSEGRQRATTAPGDAVIDATGKYVMPGIVNTHMHWHEERQPGIPQPIQYERNLYLAAGVTTAREVGGDFAKSKQWQAESDAHKIIAPRILVYPFTSKGRTGAPSEIREWIRNIKERGADGLKFIGGWDRDQLEAGLDEAHKLGLRTAAHIAVDETNARDYAELGVTSIEHFYGVADAALRGIQDFPADMNLNNETHRFGRAGELYEQADPEQLHKVIDLMVAKHVAWDPTFSIYEASRDLIRAENQPWFKDYLHPSMEEYFKASTTNHGSYFFGWTSTEENHWRQQYRIWMDAVLEFARKGGMVTTGDDAGYIFSMYGFGISRELELQEEAGFKPLEVIEHATWNGARLIGMEDRLGKVREGFIADLLVVNGNPLENLRLLNPYGTDVMTVNGKVVSNYTPIQPGDRVQNVHGGGIEWTIKDGIPYHVPTLMREVKEMVAHARTARGRTTTAAQ